MSSPPDEASSPGTQGARRANAASGRGLDPGPSEPSRESAPLSAPAHEEDALELSHPLARDVMLNPSRWRLWPAVAVLRWLLRKAKRRARRIVYRSRPSLSFPASEIHDVVIGDSDVDLVLTAPGLAAPGSPLPSADIARIMEDQRRGGALAAWLDGPADCFMHALEAARERSNAAFALATGGRIEALHLAARLVGVSAPLAASAGGRLSDTHGREPAGAAGLGAAFVGPISAAGLAEVFRAFTSLPTRVEEFSGAEVRVSDPARLGGRIGRILGSKCRLPAAGIEIELVGGIRPEAREWARDPARRGSLRLLALAYVGSPSPAARLFLRLDPGNVPPAALDGETALGGLAVLGRAERPVRLALES